ncbi:MAG: hypothetical protein IJ991_00090 [Thermoguttaceae bacterium]|nr:hypothetical protein [Thermoguttaceae bacterium]
MKFKRKDLALALEAVAKFRDKRAYNNIYGVNKYGRRVLDGKRRLPGWFAAVDLVDGCPRFRSASRFGKAVAIVSGKGSLGLPYDFERLVDPETLRRVLDEAEGETIELDFDGGAFVVRSGSALAATWRIETTVEGLDAFPDAEIGIVSRLTSVQTPSERFWRAVDAADGCVGDCDGRGSSPGVVVDLRQNVVFACASSVATVCRNVGTSKETAPSANVPPSFLGRARAVLGGVEELEIGLDEEFCVLTGEVGDALIQVAAPVFERTPELRSLVELRSPNPETVATATARSALATIGLADLVSDEMSRAVQLTFEPSPNGGGTLIAAARSQAGRCDAAAPVEFRGSAVARWFDARRLIDFLASVDPDELVAFELCADAKRPLCVATGDRLLFLGASQIDYAI